MLFLSGTRPYTCRKHTRGKEYLALTRICLGSGYILFSVTDVCVYARTKKSMIPCTLNQSRCAQGRKNGNCAGLSLTDFLVSRQEFGEGALIEWSIWHPLICRESYSSMCGGRTIFCLQLAARTCICMTRHICCRHKANSSCKASHHRGQTS